MLEVCSKFPTLSCSAKVLGAHLTLDTPAERAEFVEHARAPFTPGPVRQAKQPTVTTAPGRNFSTVGFFEARKRFANRSDARRISISNDE